MDLLLKPCKTVDVIINLVFITMSIYNKEYQRYQIVRTNTTLLFVDVEQTDYMFRPLSIRPSSGLARPEDGLIDKGRNM